MRKILSLLLGLTLLAGAAWTGFWFYGKNRIVQEIEAQAQLVRDRGGEVAYDGVNISGFPFGYKGRIEAPTMSLTQQTPSPFSETPLETSYTWSAPWVEARAVVSAPDTVTFIFPEKQDMVLTLPTIEEGTPRETIPMTMLSEDFVVTTIQGDDEILFNGNAKTMRLNGSFEQEASEKMDIAYSVQDFSTEGRVDTTANDGTALPIALTYTTGALDADIKISGGEDVASGSVILRSGATEGAVDWTGSHTSGGGTVADVVVTLDFPVMGGKPIEVAIAALDVQSRVPNAAGPEKQDFAYRIGIEDITLDDDLWAMVDPVSAFPRDINTVRIDLSGDAVFNALPSDPEAFMRASETGFPIDVDTVSLNDLTVDALGLHAVGSGMSTLSGETPEGTGTLSVEGFSEFMNSLVKSGRIPPQQAMVVQLMVESFGKPDETGESITFDFEARDGMIYVNSIPVGEAPTMP